MPWSRGDVVAEVARLWTSGTNPKHERGGSETPELWRDRLRETNVETFHYKDKGTMATIGRAAAVAEIGRRQFCGLFAWLLWLFVHLMLIVQFQNRVLILLQWAWSYATFNRSNRIISGEQPVIVEHYQPDA